MDALTILVFLPLVGALLIATTKREQVATQRMLALATTGAVALMGAWLFLGFDGSIARAQEVTRGTWFVFPGAEFAVEFKLGVDGLSILMVALTAVMMPLVMISTWSSVTTRVKEFTIWMLVMETGMLGVFLSLDLVLFYFFWEISLIPLYFLVGIWGGERRLYATVKFFLYTVAGSLLMLIAVIALIMDRGTSDIVALTASADSMAPALQVWIFGGFALAFAIKVPLLPFHTWLADAHTEAPTSGSVVLAAVLLKLGTYGLVRFCIGMFTTQAVE